MNIKLRPYDLFIPVVVILLVASYFIPAHKTLDIHLWDAYYIVTLPSACLISALFVLFFWILYRLTGPLLFSVRLTWIHVVMMIAVFAFLVVAPLISDSIFNPPPVRFMQVTHPRLFGPRDRKSVV